MEMRSLIRTLRARPTSRYTTRPSSILQGQFLAPHLSLRFASSNNSPSNAPRGPQSNQSSPSNSDVSDFDQILDKLNLDSTPPNRRGPYSSSSVAASSSSPSSAPQQRSAGEFSAVARAAGAASMSDRHLRKVSLKLGPSLGRREHVEPERGTDLAMAMQKLHRACINNNVKQDMYAQKFHIRRGQVRKNQRINRWRKLFKYSFNHTVDRIKRMRAQGW